MQYEVVWAQGDNMRTTLEKLKTEVNILSQKGWKPQGGVSVTVIAKFEWYNACQAMVK